MTHFNHCRLMRVFLRRGGPRRLSGPRTGKQRTCPSRVSVISTSIGQGAVACVGEFGRRARRAESRLGNWVRGDCRAATRRPACSACTRTHACTQVRTHVNACTRAHIRAQSPNRSGYGTRPHGVVRRRAQRHAGATPQALRSLHDQWPVLTPACQVLAAACAPVNIFRTSVSNCATLPEVLCVLAGWANRPKTSSLAKRARRGHLPGTRRRRSPWPALFKPFSLPALVCRTYTS